VAFRRSFDRIPLAPVGELAFVAGVGRWLWMLARRVHRTAIRRSLVNETSSAPPRRGADRHDHAARRGARDWHHHALTDAGVEH
jgi:hypothetical protein